MRRISTLAFALLCALLSACSTTPSSRSYASEIAALERVIESFQASILKKDKSTFTSLFFSDKPELITWQSVLDDPSLVLVQKTRPQAMKARYRSDNNFIAFIDSVVDSKTTEEERFSNVAIDTDGEIASVSFDYVYLSDGRPTNRGREKWLLVRTEQGWKITSVLYSVRLPGASGA